MRRTLAKTVPGLVHKNDWWIAHWHFGANPGALQFCQAIRCVFLASVLVLLNVLTCHSQDALFEDDFDGPTLSLDWVGGLPDGLLTQGAIPGRTKLTNSLPHNFELVNVEGRSVLQMTEALEAGYGQGWITKGVFNLTNFLAEVRFRGVPDTSVPTFQPSIRIWLVDAINPNRFLSFLVYRSNSQFGVGHDNGIDGVTSGESTFVLPETNHNWLRLTIEGARGRLIKFGLNTDQEETFYENQFPYFTTVFTNGFRLGLSVESKNAYFPRFVGFQVDKISLRPTPLDPTSTIYLEAWRGALEGEEFALIDVIRIGDLTEEVSIKYETKAATARPGEHYHDVAGILVFAPGVSTQQIKVPLINDGLPTNDKRFSIHLQSGSELARIHSPGQAYIPIFDNDQGFNMFVSESGVVKEGGNGCEITVMRGSDLKRETSVDLVVESRTASAGEDYRPISSRLTFAPNEQFKKLKLQIVDDFLIERDQLLILALANPSVGTGLASHSTSIPVTIIDNDKGVLWHNPTGNEYLGMDITLYRSDGLQHAVTVSYETKDLTAKAGIDYKFSSGNITFEQGVSSKIIHVPGIDNDQRNAADREFQLDVKSNSPFLAGGTFVVKLDDDDPVQFNFEGADENVTEGQPMRVRILRSGQLAGTNTFVLKYQLNTNSSCLAVPGKDFVPLEGEIFFGPKETEKWLDLNFPDNSFVDNQGRCASFSIMRVEGDSMTTLLAKELAIQDNEVSYVSGLTQPILRPYQPFEFVTLADGSAFVLGVPGAAPVESLPTIIRIGPDLRIDKTFRAALPPNIVLSKIDVDPSGRLLAAGVRAEDSTPVLLSFNLHGALDPLFQQTLPMQSVSAVKVDQDGNVYVAGTNQLVRVLANGNLDPLFKETVFRGNPQKIWIEESGVYVGGTFQVIDGASLTNAGLFRLEPNGGIDHSFTFYTDSQDNPVSHLITMTNGNLLVYCYPELTVINEAGSKLAEYQVSGGGCVFGNCWSYSWDGHVQTANGDMVALKSSSGGFFLRSFDLAQFHLGADSIIPSNSFSTGTRPIGLFAGGEYLWLAEQDIDVGAFFGSPNLYRSENLMFRRLSLMKEDAQAFGITEVGPELKVLGDQALFVIQRYGNSSLSTTVEYTIKQITPNTGWEQTVQTGQAVFGSNEIEKSIFLNSQLADTSLPLNLFSVSIQYPQSSVIGGTTYARVLVSGKQPSGDLQWHLYPGGTVYEGALPFFMVTGSDGTYRVEFSEDLVQWHQHSEFSLGKEAPSNGFFPSVAEPGSSKKFYRVVPASFE